MATIGYADLPVPDGGDAPDSPAALAALATVIDPHLIQHVANTAERDSVYSAAPLHTVVSAEDGSLWIKTSATLNVWATIYEPLPPWQNLTLESGLIPNGGHTPQYRIIGQRAHVRGRVERFNQLTLDGSSGMTLAAVPEEAQPADGIACWAGGQSLTGDPVTAVCRVEAVTTYKFYSQDGSGAAWVDITGSYWLD
ncbi:hypothetical protein [Streptomyces sp. NPDC054887]